MPMAMGMPGLTTTVVVTQGAMVAPTSGADMLSTLALLKGLFVSQQVELLEILTGCETSNKYIATAWDPVLGAEKPSQGKVSGELFKLKERSNCLLRQLCGPRRPFHMSMFPLSPSIPTVMPTGADPFVYRDALVLERPFKCTFLCFWRSVIRVKHNALGYIGEVENPFSFLDWVFHVRAPKPDAGMTGPIAEFVRGTPGEHWYTVVGSICQFGMWLPPLPCGPCKRVSFKIFSAKDVGRTRPIGEIAKVWSGCLKEAFSDADNYTIAFPADASPVQKAVLVATTMLIDFLLFEQPPNKNNNHSISG